MKSLMRFPIFVLLIVVLNCGAFKVTESNAINRSAENTPEGFLPPTDISLDPYSCKSPMTDPRDGTKIILYSSTDGIGNYTVPEGKYGVMKGELLRLDCTTGKPLGIVKK